MRCRIRSLLPVAASGGALVVNLFVAGPAQAWGDAGHQIVASIAYAHLNAATRRSVDNLLKADRDPLTAPDFASRATWADRYRDSDRGSTNIHYAQTREWHFADIELVGGTLDVACHGRPPLPPALAASAGPAAACVVDKIEQFSAELRSAATPPAEKLLALKFVMHFVGDLHQPLHAADRHDRGGNEVSVSTGATGPTSNLHAYWDTWLVARLGSNAAAVAQAIDGSISAAQARRWAVGGPDGWVLESNRVAATVAYDFSGEATYVDDKGGTGERLDAVYAARALPAVRQQLARAGIRLAAQLNRSFDAGRVDRGVPRRVHRPVR